jgi:putative membrane protein
MTVVVWIFALVAAVVHLLAFAWETLLFQRPSVHEGVFAIPTADVPPVRLWAFNVGFYKPVHCMRSRRGRRRLDER